MLPMKKLVPYSKPMADFRKDNVDCIKPVFKEFVYTCRSLYLWEGSRKGWASLRRKINSTNRFKPDETDGSEGGFAH